MGISFDDAVAAPQKVSFEDAVTVPVPKFQDESPLNPIRRLAVSAGDAMAKTYKNVLTDPAAELKGELKAVGGGAVQLADLAAQGLTGMFSAAGGGSFAGGQEGAQQAMKKAKDYTAAISRMNLTPDGKHEEAAAGLLQVLGQVPKAGGEAMYLQTGNAIAAASTEGLLTALMLKPGIAGKVFKGIETAPKSKVSGAFDDLAANSPEKAAEMANHVAEADPGLAKYMKSRIDKFTDASDKTFQDFAKERAKAAIDEMTPPPMKDLIGDLERPGAKPKAKSDEPPQQQPQNKRLTYGGAKVYVDTMGRVSKDPSKLGPRRLTQDKAPDPQAEVVYDKHDMFVGAGGRASTDPFQAASPRLGYDPQFFVNKGGIASTALTMDKVGANFREINRTTQRMLEAPTVENVGNPVKGSLTFKTEKGSSYRVTDKGTTVRNKTLRDQVGHEGDQGVKPESENTYYVTPEDANKLGEFQAQGAGRSIVKHKDGRLGIRYDNGKDAGKFEQRTMVGHMGAPQVGLIPVEIWKGGKEVHFGNKIVEVNKPKGGFVGGEDPTLFHTNDKPTTQGQIIKAFDADGLGGYPDAPYGNMGMSEIASLVKDKSFRGIGGRYQGGAVDPNVIAEGILKVGKGVVNLARKIPATSIMEGQLKVFYESALNTFNPEGLGPKAKAAAATTAKYIAEAAQKDAYQNYHSKARKAFWDSRAKEASQFISTFEAGKKFADPVLQKAADGYKAWGEKIFKREQSLGFKYEPVDNYLYHIYEKGDELVQRLNKQYGKKWADPSFIKDRAFSMYDQAKEWGFKPKYTNPEDIMLARQHASDIAEMRVNILDELERFGHAVKAGKGIEPPDYKSVEWRSPTGQRYYVHADAARILHNAFESKSLWSMEGPVGSTFRGGMFLKNTLVPIKLSLSLFHPLHVLGIDNAAAMTRVSKELLSGKMNPVTWVANMAKSGLMIDSLYQNPKAGGRLINLWKGKIEPLNAADRDSLRYMNEGGFVPEMSTQYRTKAYEGFKKALRDRSLSAPFRLPFAALDLMQRPLFEHWIPALKAASYNKDVSAALRTDPTLINDSSRRQLAFRKLAKSVDNRYGEMAYNTLFWTKWMKDLGVLNTLSLGWNLGFLREYGGGAMDLGQFAKGKGGPIGKVKSGLLDRPLFVSMYTAQALAIGGLMTYALTGKPPQTFQDYIQPQSGDKNKDGSPQRLSTMYYTREFLAIGKHIQQEGVAAGMEDLASSKASGMIGMVKEWATGVDSYGKEYRDPDSPAFKKLAETVDHTLSELKPITMEASEKTASTKGKWLSYMGFNQAPRYSTESNTEAKIRSTFQDYYAPKLTPYDRAQFSDDARKLKQLGDSGKDKEYTEMLDKMQEKFDLSPQETRKLQGERGGDPLVKMFQRFSVAQQKKLLDQMTPEERETYLPHANKRHLRYSYEAPEEKK